MAVAELVCVAVTVRVWLAVAVLEGVGEPVRVLLDVRVALGWPGVNVRVTVGEQPVRPSTSMAMKVPLLLLDEDVRSKWPLDTVLIKLRSLATNSPPAQVKRSLLLRTVTPLATIVTLR